MTDRTCDVLVVGGGPAGLLLAGLLAQQGVGVVVLERRTEPGTHSRAIGLHPPAVTALQHLGLGDEAVAQGMPITSGAARSRGRDLGHLSFARSWPKRPYVLALPQSRTEALLARHLWQLDAGALQRGWEIIEVTDQGGTARVVADRGGERIRWRARVVVGADGARSTVRDRAGITTDLTTYPDTYLMGDFADAPAADAVGPAATGADAAGPAATGIDAGPAATGTDASSDGRQATIHIEPDGVVESFPLPEASRRWVAHTGSAPAASGPADLTALIRDRTGERVETASNSMISAFTVRRRIARHMVGARTVLIGDAAHEISPIGGQGITLGWLDALALAPLLEDVLTHDIRLPLWGLSGFRSFEQLRLRAARTAGRLAQVNMTLGRPLPAPAARAREAALRAALNTPVSDRMARAYTMGWA